MSEVSLIHRLDINAAPLPVAYENAKNAIMECVNIDECKDWADKAQALASYARQSRDNELEKMSKRIRARAMRRCGELLKMFDGRADNAKKQKAGDDPLLSKNEIGESVGMSNRQIKTANRLSNIPEDDFNNQIDSNNIPTLTELAEQGTKKLDYLYQKKPEGFSDAIALHGMAGELLILMEKHDPDYIIHGMDDRSKKEMTDMIAKIESWFDKFMVKI